MSSSTAPDQSPNPTTYNAHDTAAIAYCESKGIYALIEHLANAIISLPEDRRPTDPLAFLADYASTHRQELHEAVREYEQMMLARRGSTSGPQQPQ